jgi:WD40 repeat protein
LKLWDVDQSEALRTLSGHNRGVATVAILPDGQRLVSGAGDGILKLWDLKSGRALQTISAHIAGVRAVALLPDGKTSYLSFLGQYYKSMGFR